MKLIVRFFSVAILFLTACKTNKKSQEDHNKPEEIALSFDTFGNKISEKDALSSLEMLSKFNSLQVGDTLNMKFSSRIKEVCSKKRLLDETWFKFRN